MLRVKYFIKKLILFLTQLYKIVYKYITELIINKPIKFLYKKYVLTNDDLIEQFVIRIIPENLYGSNYRFFINQLGVHNSQQDIIVDALRDGSYIIRLEKKDIHVKYRNK